ncbi:MAG: flagellar motor protein MotB [Rhodospirillales bacterium]
MLREMDIDLPENDPPHAPDIVPVFLGLFLLVLAFFIMLVSISTFEKVKSNAVMDSLSSTFTTVLPPTSDPTAFNAKDGDIIAGEAFQEQVTSLFSTAVQIEKIEVVQPGRLMRLYMPASALFKADEPAVRDDMLPLLDRIVATLSNRPPGLRQDMEVVVGTPLTGNFYLPVQQGIDMARAGELARTMIGRGAPPDSVSVGVKSGDPGNISIWFWVRGIEETEVRFENALDEMRKRTLPPVPVEKTGGQP